MSENAVPAPKKGGKAKKLILILAAVALLGGGGAAAGFYAAGTFSHKEGPAEDPRMPKLVKKGENPEEIAAKFAAATRKEGAEGKPLKAVDLPAPANPSAYQATYYQIPTSFTSNMADSDAFAQISIAVSTYYDQRVIMAVQAHELAIRSAILMMLAQEQEIDLATPRGKEALQKKLVRIINDVLKQKTGYGGVDNAYFTNFVIQ